METDRIRPRNACINRMGGFGTIHGSGFSDADSENLGQKSDDDRKCLRRYRRMTKAGEVLLVARGRQHTLEAEFIYPSVIIKYRWMPMVKVGGW